MHVGEPVIDVARPGKREIGRHDIADGAQPSLLPVARVMVDVPLAHLDHLFDYAVPSELSDTARPGCRIRVRFAGRLVDAFVLERAATAAHEGTLSPVQRVVSAQPVLTPATTRLFRAVADRWAGSFVDVVRLGVPPRHARAEVGVREPAPVPTPPQSQGWDGYQAGAAFLSAVRAGRSARAVWSARPGEDWPVRLAEAMRTALAGGRGALAVVPDARDLSRLHAAVTAAVGEQAVVALSADLGPAERYRRWLAVRRGAVNAVIGTRAAALAPVVDLGLVAVWDDGDDLHVEPRAPYPNVRDVLVLRSTLEGPALLIGGFARTAEAALLVESGWAHDVVAARAAVRATGPRVIATGDEREQERDPAATAARLPSLALRTARESLARQRPVLVQVPRRGYAPSLACVRDRTPARCPVCAGPLAATSERAVPACRWCGRPAAQWRCPVCGDGRMRATVVGAGRTAEELGRAFPGVAVRTSGGGAVLAEVPDRPAVVVATPGAEPLVAGGYGAALLLDGWALLSRPDLRAAEETLRRWMNAAALVGPEGTVVVAADASVPTVQALVRWDPAGHALRELAERGELGFPPVTRIAAVTGTATAVREFVDLARLPDDCERIGPVETEGAQHRLLLRVPRAHGGALAAAAHAAMAARSARKAPDPVRVVLDPAQLM